MTQFQKPEQSGQAAALPKKPLSAAFASMGKEFTQAHLDGLIQMNEQEIKAVVASDWFQSLKQSQKALYVVKWFHLLAVGSNQHKQRVRKDSTRFAAGAAQTLIQRAANV